jgi:hypothetical protein
MTQRFCIRFIARALTDKPPRFELSLPVRGPDMLLDYKEVRTRKRLCGLFKVHHPLHGSLCQLVTMVCWRRKQTYLYRDCLSMKHDNHVTSFATILSCVNTVNNASGILHQPVYIWFHLMMALCSRNML